MLVSKSGSKLWRLKYRISQKEKTLSCGAYPIVSLKEAREKREDAKRLLDQGIDPSQHKQDQKRQKALEAENSFQEVALEWWTSKRDGWSENHAKTVWRRLENDAFPILGGLPIVDIMPPMMVEMLRSIEQRGAHEVARRVRAICSQVFVYAIAVGKGTINPASDLSQILKPYAKGHYAALSTSELPEFVQALHLNHARLYPQTRLAMEMLLLTFVRTSELIKATWDEFDFEAKIWTIQAARMKMRREHIVPLSSRVIEILSELKSMFPQDEYLFPSVVKAHSHISNNTILKALERMGYKDRMTGHGFRALATSTLLEELKYPYQVIDLQLAHQKKDKIEAAYNRATFMAERTEMMQAWSDYIEGLKQVKL